MRTVGALPSRGPVSLSALLMALLLGSAAVIAADMAMDGWVRGLRQSSLPLVGDLLRLVPTMNDGAAFGLLRGAGPWLLVLSVVALGAMVVLARRHVTRFALIPAALLFGGGVANLLERARHGPVLDYFDLGLGSLRWPTFNLSDVAISLGVVLIAFLYLVVRPSGDQTPPGDFQ